LPLNGPNCKESMRFKLGIFLVLSLFRTLAAVEPFEVAEKRAKQENKPLMIFFMGSGWCHWCEEMKKKILSKREFLRNVENDFIVLEVDFPRGIGKKKNEMTYKKRFGIGRYPTVVIYDPRTDKLFRESGFRDISPKDYALRLKEKFFENGFEGIHIGKGGSWGTSPNRDLDAVSKDQITKSVRYTKGPKVDNRAKQGEVKKQDTDGFEPSTNNPVFEWIQKSFEKEAVQSPDESAYKSYKNGSATTNDKATEFLKETYLRSTRKEPEIRWEKYPRGVAAKGRMLSKKIKKVEAKLVRIGFGGSWWVFQTR
jgi:thioredoxin-related protein